MRLQIYDLIVIHIEKSKKNEPYINDIAYNNLN